MTPDDLRLVSFPSADATFRSDVERAAEGLTAQMSDDECKTHLLAALRTWYRAVEISRQDDLAQHDFRPTRVWYVYRDGRVRRENRARERFYAALSEARGTVDVSRTVLADARAVARTAGYRDGRQAPAAGAEEPAAPDQSAGRTTNRV